MTEKRFIKYVPDSSNYTYVESILDRKTGIRIGYTDDIIDLLNVLAEENEQLKQGVGEMFERFKIHWENNQWIFDAETGETYSSIDARKLIDILNDLNNENTDLHIQNDFLKDENRHMRDLVNKNKELKRENHFVKSRNQKINYCNECLQIENEQLKKEIKELEDENEKLENKIWNCKHFR